MMDDGFTLQNEPPNWFINGAGGGITRAGVSFNEETAKRFTAVFGCIRILSETLASMPCILYKERDPGNKKGGKDRATDHPLYDILKTAANEEMPSYNLKETMMNHCTSSGNCYAQIVKNRRGEVISLNLLPWNVTDVRKNIDTYKLEYTTNDRGKMVTLPYSEVFHVPGLGFNGIKGYSPIRMAMEAIGLGLAAETFASNFYGQGTHLGGVLKHPGTLSDTAHKNLKNDFQNKYKGLYNSHEIPILEEGMEFVQLGIKPEEAQFIETRRFQLEEVARIYRVPLHMLQDLERSTNNNIEHQSLEFIMYTMLPWFTRWEQMINFKLLSKNERTQGYHAEFLINALLKGDTKSRATMLHMMRQNGIINADDWRELENMNPQDGEVGKYYFINGNMIPVETAAKNQPKQAQQSPKEGE
jgi:HK97 family phage portal protein